MKNLYKFIIFVFALLKEYCADSIPEIFDYNVQMMDPQTLKMITFFNMDISLVEQKFLFICFFPGTDKEIIIESLNENSNAVKDFKNSFNKDVETKIVIHGWNSNSTRSSIHEIIDAYREVQKFNVIAVDFDAFHSYTLVSRYSKRVGEHIAKFICSLISELDADPKKMHLLGHSVGAHMAGFTGKSLTPRIKRITGLDPALPLFSKFSEDFRLDKNDADFVDVIHTASGFLGYGEPLGHADFYPNDGKTTQPGCFALIPILNVKCSHSRVTAFFAESILDTEAFYSQKCNSWSEFKKSICELKLCRMGEYADSSCAGKFYLRTNPKSPYSIKLLDEIKIL